MKTLKPKEQHEQFLADADKEKIIQHLSDGQDQAITKIAVILARSCNLLVHFRRLWQMRVSGLDPKLSTEKYMQRIYVNKSGLYKELVKAKA